MTEFREDYLRHRGPDVYDPDGYLRQLAEEHPIDEVEARFLSQAVRAFHADIPDAAAVMLGAVAEHLVELLAEAIAVAATVVAPRVGKLTDRPALAVLDFVRKYLEDRKKLLSRPLREELATTFGGVASMIRVARNSGGHPALSPVDCDQALVLLRLFPLLRRWVYAVIAELGPVENGRSRPVVGRDDA